MSVGDRQEYSFTFWGKEVVSAIIILYARIAKRFLELDIKRETNFAVKFLGHNK